MRRRRSSVLRTLVGVAVLLVATRRAAVGTDRDHDGLEGGPELLLPTGARGLGMAQAIVASGIGAEAILVGIRRSSRTARAKSRSTSSQQANGVTVADVTTAIVWPVPRVGAFALSVRYLNEGEQPAVNDQQDVVGSFDFTRIIVAGTFAAQFGDRLAARSDAQVSVNSDRSARAVCDLPPSPPRTGAIDFGVQYFLTKDSLIAVGASGLNLGLPLQVNDSPQADHAPESRRRSALPFAPKFSQYAEGCPRRMPKPT